MFWLAVTLQKNTGFLGMRTEGGEQSSFWVRRRRRRQDGLGSVYAEENCSRSRCLQENCLCSLFAEEGEKQAKCENCTHSRREISYLKFKQND
jgi:hypothetical protein